MVLQLRMFNHYVYSSNACVHHHQVGGMISIQGGLYEPAAAVPNTALHRELRDYSLRQIAFAGFRAVICHHTAALPSKRVVNKRL